MRISSLKFLSFGLALASLVAAGGASAQSLVGVNTSLDHTLDSRKAASGEVVTTRLDNTVTTADGTKLPKGTELIGKVADVKKANDAVTLSLVFTTAKLKDGKQIPVKATVLAAFPQVNEVDEAVGGAAQQPAPEHVASDGAFNQEAGALAHVALNSAVKSSDSGTFSSDKGDFRLQAGTNLQMGIASANASSGLNAAE